MATAARPYSKSSMIGLSLRVSCRTPPGNSPESSSLMVSSSFGCGMGSWIRQHVSGEPSSALPESFLASRNARSAWRACCTDADNFLQNTVEISAQLWTAKSLKRAIRLAQRTDVQLLVNHPWQLALHGSCSTHTLLVWCPALATLLPPERAACIAAGCSLSYLHAAQLLEDPSRTCSRFSYSNHELCQQRLWLLHCL
jgi:hypothetical protein